LRTPLIRLNADGGPAEIYLKLENLQPIGSFKLRGAGNAMLSASPEKLARGVYTASAGNMAQGVAWNARDCSGEPNRSLRFTHSGATEDLQTVLAHIFSTRDYAEVALIGFSLGGNLTLKYAGERAGTLDPRIKKAVAFSAPCNLRSSSIELAKPANWFYMRHFLVARGEWNDGKERDLLAECTHKVEAAVGEYLGITKPATDAMFEHLFATPPAHLHEQRLIARKYASKSSGH